MLENPPSSKVTDDRNFVFPSFFLIDCLIQGMNDLSGIFFGLEIIISRIHFLKNNLVKPYLSVLLTERKYFQIKQVASFSLYGLRNLFFLACRILSIASTTVSPVQYCSS